MHLPLLSLPLITILLFQTLPLASPSPLATTSSSPLLPRSYFCSNAPATKAGTPLPRTLHPHTPTPPSIWCTPGSSTWLQLTYTSPIAGPSILEIIDQSYAFIQYQLATVGDGVILGGMFNWYGRGGRALSVIDAANHQCTWGVLGAAVRALGEFMREGERGVGGVYFVVSDGVREVAVGTLG